MGETTFARITEILSRRSAKHVVEFGSGRSTLRLWAATKARITSVEHDASWAERVRADVRTQQVEVVSCPLEFRSFGGHELHSYAQHVWSDAVDAVIIDGPPYWTIRGREACLYDVYEALPIGAVVFLDDCYREGETAALRNWRAVYGGAFVEQLERASHGLAVLEKVAHVRPRWDAPERRADAQAVGLIYAEMRRLLTGTGDFGASWWPLDALRRAYGISPRDTDARALRSSLGRLSEILAPRLNPSVPPVPGCSS